MSTQIQDGTGSKRKLKVTSANRALVQSVVISEEDEAIIRGEGYQIVSGTQSFTGSTETGVLYIKNNDDRDFVLDRAVLILGSTNGTGDWTFQTLRNPTAGTIVDNALAAGISNSNHGSAKQPRALSYRGVEGDTMTDGTGAPLPIQQTQNRTVFPLGRRLPTNTSIGWKLTPPSGNTSTKAVLVTHFYYDLSRI